MKYWYKIKWNRDFRNKCTHMSSPNKQQWHKKHGVVSLHYSENKCSEDVLEQSVIQRKMKSEYWPLPHTTDNIHLPWIIGLSLTISRHRIEEDICYTGICQMTQIQNV